LITPSKSISLGAFIVYLAAIPRGLKIYAFLNEELVGERQMEQLAVE